nr:hypothetical protein [Tanacetum cinerariifolium]
MGQVAVELQIDAAFAEFGFELVDALHREKLVLGAPMPLHRHLDGRRVEEFQRRHAIKHHPGGQLGNEVQGQQSQRAAHAEAGYADFLAVAFEVIHRAANVLGCCVGKVEFVHQVRHQRKITGCGKAIGNPADLIVQAPPLLDDHHGRRPFGLGRTGEIAADFFTVRAFERDGGARCVCQCLRHGMLPAGIR